MPKAILGVSMEILRQTLHLPESTTILAVMSDAAFDRIVLLLEDPGFAKTEKGKGYPEIKALFHQDPPLDGLPQPVSVRWETV